MKSLTSRPLVFLTLFAMVVLAGDRLLAGIVARAIDRSQFRYSKLYRGGVEADVVIFGDSRGVHTFHAPSLGDSLGMRAVNMGYNGMSTEVIECLVSDYLEHSPAPKFLVLEITNVFQAPSSLANMKPYLRHSPLLSNLYCRERPEDYFGTQVSRLYQFNCELSMRVLYFMNRSDQGWILTSTMDRGRLSSIRDSEQNSASSDSAYLEKNLAALDRILSLANKKGVEVRLVIAPYWPDYFNGMTERRSIIRQIQDRTSLATQNSSSGAIWDYSLLLDRPEYFADRIHVNRSGADRLRQQFEEDDFFKPGSFPKGNPEIDLPTVRN